MERVGVLIVSKCLSAAAIVDTLSRSDIYQPEFFIAERQVNPFNFERAEVHSVIPDLNVEEVAKFAARHKERIAFGLTDTEDFVTAGGRDVVERESSVPMICVTKKYAVEKSKADQRLLFDRIFKNANPRYQILDPKKYRGEDAAVARLRKIAREIQGIVIKPDAPARGAGVGVWGNDFRTDAEMIAFFRSVYSKGRVVVEEKVDGEESSFQALSDGRHFVVGPLTRDYKRSLDGDEGKLTGGMGSYRGPNPYLPFLEASQWDEVVRAEEAAFRKWKGKGSNPEMRGIVLYDALMHTGRGFKVLERNSRGGNTEQLNLLTTIKDDFVEVCFRIIEGRLRGIRFSRQASVATCVVPPAYGTSTARSEIAETIDLAPAYSLQEEDIGKLRIFPMDVKLEQGKNYIGTSRTVAVVGVDSSVEGAREISLGGARKLGGHLRFRSDIASRSSIKKSRDHLKFLRTGHRSG